LTYKQDTLMKNTSIFERDFSLLIFFSAFYTEILFVAIKGK